MEFPVDAPSFSLNGVQTARITSLHDGDTFTAVFRVGDEFYKFPVRIARIDTPEMTSKMSILRTKAFLARDRLFGLLTKRSDVDTVAWRKKEFDEYFRSNPTVLTGVECVGMDKYGRVLANVEQCAEILVNEKLAYWYDGGTKLSEDQILAVVR